MSTQTQSSYISDLVVRKTKEFKEIKELIVAHNIAKESAVTIANAGTISDITNALTDAQASKLIDVLVTMKDPIRSTEYAQPRVKKTIDLLDSIKNTVDHWSFL